MFSLYFFKMKWVAVPVTPSRGQALAYKLGNLPQGAARDDDSQVEGAAHQVHTLYLVILVDALRDAVKAVEALGHHLHLDQGGDALPLHTVPVDDGLIAEDCAALLQLCELVALPVPRSCLPVRPAVPGTACSPVPAVPTKCTYPETS